MKIIPIAITAMMMATPAAAQSYIKGTIGAVVDGPSRHQNQGQCFRPNPRTGACNTFTRQIEEREQGFAAEVAVGREFGKNLRAEGAISYMRNESNRSGCVDCSPSIAANGFAYTPSKRIGATDRISMTARVLAVAPMGKIKVYGGVGYGAIATLSNSSLPEKGGWRIHGGELNDVGEFIVGAEYQVSPKTLIVMQGVQQQYTTDYAFKSHAYTLINTTREKTIMRAVTVGVRIKLGKK